ncbi:MAG: ATP-dependent RNA helicase Bcep18194_A5658 [uncultured Caballeronia sp.]|nr:MAG: ATP-dependent RNA helicase Bcep18194_A5658 [uncultured Caballeronia sp.]
MRALMLTPTRELADQVAANVQTYSKHTPLRSTVVFGGVDMNPRPMRCAAASKS